MLTRLRGNVLADASLERPADVSHNLIRDLWLKRCDINELCGDVLHEIHRLLSDLKHKGRNNRMGEPCPATFGLKVSVSECDTLP